jgi:hypothetical protein
MPSQVHLMPQVQQPTPDQVEEAFGEKDAPEAPKPEEFPVAEHLERQRILAAVADVDGHQVEEHLEHEEPATREGSPFDDFPVDDL